MYVVNDQALLSETVHFVKQEPCSAVSWSVIQDIIINSFKCLRSLNLSCMLSSAHLVVIKVKNYGTVWYPLVILFYFILMRTTTITFSCVCEFEGLTKRALIKWSWGKCFKIAKQLK